ncbi:MAG: ParB N-terminal domain-containing protein [Bryobacteraceae bacterium]
MVVINQEYELAPVDAVRPHPKNPRRGDAVAIADSIVQNGFYGAVVAQRSTGFILAGNHRWKAAKDTGAETIPVIWVDCDEDEALRILLVDNRTNDLADYDTEALHRVIEEVLERTGSLEGTGYDPDFLQSAEDAQEETKTLLDQAVQLRPQREYVVVMCEDADEFERLKLALSLKMVRRGGYKAGSQFDAPGVERVIYARKLLGLLNAGSDSE